MARFDTVQPRYNLLYRRNELELFELCRLEGVGVIPYNPLAGGLLTGKHNASAAPPDGRFTLGSAGERYQDRYWHDRQFATVEALRPVAAEAGMSLTQMAIAWCLAQPAITAPIVGASRPGQLTDAVAALDNPLDGELLKRLDAITDDYQASDDLR